MTIAESPPGVDPARLKEAAAAELARRFLIRFVVRTFPGYDAERFHRWLADRLGEFEAAVERRESPRLMIFAPPQHGKSELVSRRFPAWVLGRHPDWKVMLASYGADLAEELSGDARAIVRGEEFAELFGAMAAEDPPSAVELDRARKSVAAWRIARHRGGMSATGVGGAITGRAADILIIDDPVKGRREADSETYREDAKAWWPQARDRVQKGGGIIVMCTRWHHDDLPGYLLKLAATNPRADQWTVLNLMAVAEEGDPMGRPVGEALAPGRFDLDDLETLRATVGSREWNAKFRGMPTAEEGGIINVNWFVRAAPRPMDEAPLAVYQFWDTAYTKKKSGDRSVGGTWKVYRNRFRLEDVVYGRFSVAELKAEMGRLYGLHRPRAVIIENESSGIVLLDEWRRETRLPILPFNPKKHGDKQARAHAATPLMEAGRVEVPTDAGWLEEFLEECRQFPSGEHDDFVDMLTMSLICMGVREPMRGKTVMRSFSVGA